MAEPFIAEIRIWGTNFAPRGWANCDGQLLPISQNTALFSLIGTIYGGDGRTTTALPNFQSIAPMHPGRGPGLTSRRIGEKGGVTTVTLDQQTIPSHTHQLMGSGDDADNDDPGTAKDRTLATVSGAALYNTGTLVDMAAQALPSVGASQVQSHTNVQPNQVLRLDEPLSVCPTCAAGCPFTRVKDRD